MPGALKILDVAVAAAVESAPANDPPAHPVEGASYLIGDSPSGEWAQYPAHLAGYGAAGWRFIAPTSGMSVFVKAAQVRAVYESAGWNVGLVRASTLVIDGQQVVGPRLGPIADPVGGSTIDDEARLAVGEILGFCANMVSSLHERKSFHCSKLITFGIAE